MLGKVNIFERYHKTSRSLKKFYKYEKTGFEECFRFSLRIGYNFEDEFNEK